MISLKIKHIFKINMSLSQNLEINQVNTDVYTELDDSNYESTGLINNEQLKQGIYIIKRGDLLNTNIYKIGKTERSLYTRHNEYKYPGTRVLYFKPVKFVSCIERLILNLLKENNI